MVIFKSGMDDFRKSDLVDFVNIPAEKKNIDVKAVNSVLVAESNTAILLSRPYWSAIKINVAISGYGMGKMLKELQIDKIDETKILGFKKEVTIEN